MKIGIISDTHGFFHPKFRELFSGTDAIIHAGDIGQESVIEQLSAIAPVTAVRGNIDGGPFFDLKKVADCDFGGIHFTITHNAGDLIRPAFDMRTRILSPASDILISGHYHAYWCSLIDGPLGRKVLWLSPGAAGNAGHHKERTALILTVKDGAVPRDDIRECISLQKISLGPREFGF